MRRQKPQKLMEMWMRHVKYNDFDGEMVADSLNKNTDLWLSYYFTRMDSLIVLRDMQQCINQDTLFIMSKPGKETALENLARTWHADEIDYLSKNEADNLLGSWGPGNRNPGVLRVWWD